MIAALPFYFGLAATAEPLVLTVLGEKWREAAPVVHLLALAMPFMTLQVLLQPACDACGRPGIGVRNGAVGALVLTIAAYDTFLAIAPVKNRYGKADPSGRSCVWLGFDGARMNIFELRGAAA